MRLEPKFANDLLTKIQQIDEASTAIYDATDEESLLIHADRLVAISRFLRMNLIFLALPLATTDTVNTISDYADRGSRIQADNYYKDTKKSWFPVFVKRNKKS